MLSNPSRRNGSFLCEDSEKRAQNGVLSTKQQSLQKNRSISLQGFLLYGISGVLCHLVQ
jgi:hypothetical protein